MAATLQRKSSGGIIFVIITKFITKETVPRNYFVIILARMVHIVHRPEPYPTVSSCSNIISQILGEQVQLPELSAPNFIREK